MAFHAARQVKGMSSFYLGALAVRTMTDRLGYLPTVDLWEEFSRGWQETAEVLVSPELHTKDIEVDDGTGG